MDIEDSRLLSFLRQAGRASPAYWKYEALLQRRCACFDTDIVVFCATLKNGSRPRHRTLLRSRIRSGLEQVDIFTRVAPLSWYALLALAAVHVQFGFLCLRGAIV